MRENNRYATSLKLFIHSGGDKQLAYALGTPKSTIYNWKRQSFESLIGSQSCFNKEFDFELFRGFHDDKTKKKIVQIVSKIVDHYRNLISPFKKIKAEVKNKTNLWLDLIKDISPKIGLTNTLNALKISYQQYAYWIADKSCPISIENLCRKWHPFQITTNELSKIKEYLELQKYAHWPKISLYLLGLRNGDFSFSLASFYKYAKLLGFGNRQLKKIDKKHKQGLKALYPNQIWHLDGTWFESMDGVKNLIYFLSDNFSGKILAYMVVLNNSAKTALEVIQEAYQKFGHMNPISEQIRLVTDGGPENDNQTVKNYISLTEIKLNHQIALKDIPQSNSKAEAINKMKKYTYLIPSNIRNHQHLIETLSITIPEHNQVKPYGPLRGLTPDEAFFQSHNNYNFKEQIQTGLQSRIITNQNIHCSGCSK